MQINLRINTFHTHYERGGVGCKFQISRKCLSWKFVILTIFTLKEVSSVRIKERRSPKLINIQNELHVRTMEVQGTYLWLMGQFLVCSNKRNIISGKIKVSKEDKISIKIIIIQPIKQNMFKL